MIPSKSQSVVGDTAVSSKFMMRREGPWPMTQYLPMNQAQPLAFITRQDATLCSAVLSERKGFLERELGAGAVAQHGDDAGEDQHSPQAGPGAELVSEQIQNGDLEI